MSLWEPKIPDRRILGHRTRTRLQAAEWWAVTRLLFTGTSLVTRKSQWRGYGD